MRGSRKFTQRGSNFDKLMRVDRIQIQYNFMRAIIGPPTKRHLNGVSLACQWWHNIECWLGSFVIFQGIRTNIAKKPYIGAGPDPLSHLAGSAHVAHMQ